MKQTIPRIGMLAASVAALLVYGCAGDVDDSAARQHLVVTQRVDEHGLTVASINTPSGTWEYDLAGAGFASLLDIEGGDWLGFAPGKGPRGEYRGLPNMGYPEGYMHAGKSVSSTTVDQPDPSLVALLSQSNDGAWAGRWDIHPDRAVMTVTKVSHPFWFLYEGTPGGTVEPDGDRWIRADGTSSPISEGWTGTGEADVDWVAFADATKDRSLLLVNHQPSFATNSYWLMQEAMTVFGFGRTKMEKHFTLVPARFSVGLVETRSPEALDRIARRWAQADAPPADPKP